MFLQDHPSNRMTPELLTSRWGRVVHVLSKYLFFAVACWRWRLRVVGWQHLPQQSDGPLMMVCNHSSEWDILVLGGIFRNRYISFMAKEELFKKPFGHWYFLTVGTFAVNRKKAEVSSIRSAKTVLNQPGCTLVIFPEGTRQSGGTVRQVKQGAAMIAAMNKVPVLPMGIHYDAASNQAVIVLEPVIPAGDSVEYYGEHIPQGMANALEKAKALGLPASAGQSGASKADFSAGSSS